MFVFFLLSRRPLNPSETLLCQTLSVPPSASRLPPSFTPFNHRNLSKVQRVSRQEFLRTTSSDPVYPQGHQVGGALSGKGFLVVFPSLKQGVTGERIPRNLLATELLKPTTRTKVLCLSPLPSHLPGGWGRGDSPGQDPPDRVEGGPRDRRGSRIYTYRAFS